jgi:hypothetical protein
MPYFPPSSAMQGLLSADNIVSQNYRMTLDPMMQGAAQNAQHWREQMARIHDIHKAQQNLSLGLTPAGIYDQNFKSQGQPADYMGAYLRDLQTQMQHQSMVGYAVPPNMTKTPNWTPPHSRYTAQERMNWPR